MGDVSDWEDHAHRGMRLVPTTAALDARRLKPRTYLFHRWADEPGRVVVQQLGTRKKTTAKNTDLKLSN